MSPPALAPARVHGSLVEVAGVGVLLLGGSGIGKSECALELVMRGHRLVADDVVMIGPDADAAPAAGVRARAPLHRAARHRDRARAEPVRRTAVADRARIELVVRLEAWGAGEVERIGLERRSEDVAGFAVEVLTLPVAPGRNIASLVEVGARNHVLRSRGKSGAEELDARVFALLRGEGG